MQGCDFVCLDVETANADQSSICCVGLAVFRDGEFIQKFKLLVDPEDYFDPFHTSIHGIEEEHVEGAPKMPDLMPTLYKHLTHSVVVHHTHFDKVAMKRVAEKYKLEPLSCRWLDSARVARRTWEVCAHSGYGLPDLSQMLGIEFEHHDAADDARACGLILQAAISQSGRPLEDWFARVEQPLWWQKSEKSRPSREANPESAFQGETIVFTGRLSRERSECADLAAAAGFDVDPGVTARTTILVVGDQDVRRLNGEGKSSKHRKAEKLSQDGQPIRIIGEVDFIALIGA